MKKLFQTKNKLSSVQIKRGKKSKKETARFFLWISPWLIGFVILTLIPLFGSLYISFTEWKIVSDPVWLGKRQRFVLRSDFSQITQGNLHILCFYHSDLHDPELFSGYAAKQ